MSKTAMWSWIAVGTVAGGAIAYAASARKNPLKSIVRMW